MSHLGPALQADQRVHDERVTAEVVDPLEQREEIRAVEVIEQPEAVDDIELAVGVSADTPHVLLPEGHVGEPVARGAVGAVRHTLGPSIQRHDVRAPQARLDRVDALAAAQVEDSHLIERARAEIAGQLHDAPDLDSVALAYLWRVGTRLQAFAREEREGLRIQLAHRPVEGHQYVLRPPLTS